MFNKITDDVGAQLKNEVGTEDYFEDFVEIPSIHLETYADVSSNRELMKNRKVVVRPSSVRSVCRVVQIAKSHHIPVVALGGATTFFASGGPTPTEEDTIVVDTRKMRRIVALDTVSNTVTVEAGITIEQLNKFLKSQGFWFPHHPESRNSATVGGSIALNGISPFATKYGQPRNLLAGLRVVLSNGGVCQIGNRTSFDNAIKLKDLFVGSEGALGIIVEATLKVYPVPAVRLKKMFGFSHTSGACATIREMVKEGLYPEISMIPSIERIYNEALLPILSNVDAAGIIEGKQAFVFISYAGEEDLVKLSMNHTTTLVERFSGSVVEESVAESYWRNLAEFGAVVTPQMSSVYNGRKYNSLRGGIPLESLADFVAAEKQAFQNKSKLIDAGITTYVILPTLDAIPVCGVLLDDGEPNGVAEFNDWADEICKLYKELGGTISATVGVGTLLRKHMSMELGGSLKIARRLRKAIDQDGLMNPGKIFPGRVDESR